MDPKAGLSHTEETVKMKVNARYSSGGSRADPGQNGGKQAGSEY